jgi:hypothetical protein
LTNSGQHGEMGRKNNQTPKCINGVKKQTAIKIAPAIGATSRGEP